VPAFVGHLDVVRKPSVLVLMPSSLDSAPALSSDVNMDMELQRFLVLWLVSRFFSFSFSSV